MGPYAVYLTTEHEPEPFPLVHHAPARVAFVQLKAVRARWETLGYAVENDGEGAMRALRSGTVIERAWLSTEA